MSLTPSILAPFYIYPAPGAWEPLYTAATAHPDVRFDIIVNPDTGPGGAACPDSNWISTLQQLSTYDNIRTLGYVHTANRFDCGDSGTDICVTTAPVEQVNANVTKYVGWGECDGGVAIDGIFFDESPYQANPDFVQYMQTASSFASSALPAGSELVFNAGAAVQDPQYWALTDYICVLENSEAGWRADGGLAAVEARVQGGFADQAAVILYGYRSGVQRLRSDVQAIVETGLGSLFVSDAGSYAEWGAQWLEFADALATAAGGQ